MIVILLRHLPAAVLAGTCYGRSDPPIQPTALCDIPRLAKEVVAKGPSRIWTSPARRCRVIADAIAAMAHLPTEIDSRLQEYDFGMWEGKAWDTIPRSALDHWAAAPLQFAPPGGESGQAFLDRVREAHDAIRATGENCAIVSHGGPLKILNALFHDQSPDLMQPAPALGSWSVIMC